MDRIAVARIVPHSAHQILERGEVGIALTGRRQRRASFGPREDEIPTPFDKLIDKRHSRSPFGAAFGQPGDLVHPFHGLAAREQ